MYKCVCGKEFNTSNQFNGHRGSCIDYLGKDRYNKIYKHRVATGIDNGNKAKQRKLQIKQNVLHQWLAEKHICETCGKILTSYYGSGRFCNRSCANKFPRNHNKKLKSYKTNLELECPYCKGIFHNQGGLTCHIIHKHLGIENKGDRKYHYITTHSRTGEYRIDFDNITVSGMKLYKQQHTCCEICGKSVTDIEGENNHFKGLCIDHDHTNNKFRGLLCVTCNRNLGWFEHNKDNVLNYLSKDY